MALTSPYQDSHHNRVVLMIVGGVLLLIILLVMGGLYGSFLKTTVAPGSTNYEKSGELKAQGLEPGNYALNFSGRDTRGGVVAASTTFEITQTADGNVTTNAPTPIVPVATQSPY